MLIDFRKMLFACCFIGLGFNCNSMDMSALSEKQKNEIQEITTNSGLEKALLEMKNIQLPAEKNTKYDEEACNRIATAIVELANASIELKKIEIGDIYVKEMVFSKELSFYSTLTWMYSNMDKESQLSVLQRLEVLRNANK